MKHFKRRMPLAGIFPVMLEKPVKLSKVHGRKGLDGFAKIGIHLAVCYVHRNTSRGEIGFLKKKTHVEISGSEASIAPLKGRCNGRSRKDLESREGSEAIAGRTR